MIIHNAWRLDFNLSLSSFEPNMRGTRNLIDFALASPHANQFRFVFTSSVGTTQSWDKSKGPYPEEVQYDARYAVGAGYGEGKYVSERVRHFQMTPYIRTHQYENATRFSRRAVCKGRRLGLDKLLVDGPMARGLRPTGCRSS